VLTDKVDIDAISIAKAGFMTNARKARDAFYGLNSPEWNVVMFAFLLSFLWEMQQMPFYQVVPNSTCLDIVRECTLATVGDAALTLTAFWTVAALSNSRQWFRRPKGWQMGIFIAVGVVITIIFEALATGPLNRWQYADSMPTLPFTGTGLVPLMMWLVMPPVTLWLVKRQLLQFPQ
jgi:hypothetical protein